MVTKSYRNVFTQFCVWLQEGMLGSYCTQNEAETEFLTSCPNYTNYGHLPSSSRQFSI